MHLIDEFEYLLKLYVKTYKNVIIWLIIS